jgi:hypothetical protein
VVVHTPPFERLLGLPVSDLEPEKEPSIYAFFRAYLGNRSLGEMLLSHKDGIRGLFCGHTHRATELVDLDRFRGINIGSDYGDVRACLLETDSEEIKRI